MSRKVLLFLSMIVISCSEGNKTEFVPDSVVDISINTQPKKTVYYDDEKLDLTGLSVTLTLNNKTTRNVPVENFTNEGITISRTQGADVNDLPESRIINISYPKTNRMTILQVAYSRAKVLIPIENALTDFDGNSYSAIQIGGQLWMAENLKTTHYRNGDEIPTTFPSTLDIANEIKPKYQWPVDGQESSVAIYGRLYTQHVMYDERNVCPEGWHVPSVENFNQLQEYLEYHGYTAFGLNSSYNFAKALSSKMYWDASSEIGAPGNDLSTNNRSGFSAIPTGIRINFQGTTFTFKNNLTLLWSADSSDQGFGYALRIQSYAAKADVSPNGDVNLAAPCRCVKD